ncbi:MAG: bifunctional (p)ppGpp synthetase/guanosine-3',5'-bis(diphosphate) 3'-pyrophosphohydrolase [Syntrophobacteraceae bacterium]|nr:bifunctional (p)ppGpp synthetase/guanosine-3',5'-bis(diphosphate) 3'-pyrophosphohydrolase [Syntrophobacteraceae bacterium]
MRFFEIVDRVLDYHPKANVALLEKAYVFAAWAQNGKVRSRGEPYLDHPLAVAGILAQMHLDEESIAAGLLHNILTLQRTGLEDLEERFGPNVAALVQGSTKLSQLDFSNRKDRQAEYVRKMILAISQDIRVVLVKLADRLHELRNLRCSESESQKLLAQEILNIYAPLAARLGIDWMKRELEDSAFRCLEPQAHEEIVVGLARTEDYRRDYVSEVQEILLAEMAGYGITGRVVGRSKHLYSIYQKMVRQNLDLQRVYDVIAFRIIVDSERACYEALGMVHGLWEPVAGRYKDYIVKPKPNMYQSLHTTVLGPRGERMEVQIRTEEMNKIANEGIAAHWLYKEKGPPGKAAQEETRRFSWLRELLEWNREWRDSKTLFDAVKVDFYPEEVYVFTPQGDVKALPKGSTPVDFAYEVHTEVGHRCVGGRVNGKLVPLRHELQSGDTIEILTSSNHRPSKDWLKFVKSSKAINRIRQWIKAEERERSVAQGKEICEREFRKKGLNFANYLNSQELGEVARGLSHKSVDDLLASIGYRKVTPLQVIGRLPSAPQEEDAARKEPLFPVEKRKPRSRDDGIIVRGADDIMTRMAKCCNPVPGEPIIGYITRGRGITVHRQSCKNPDRGDAERKIDVQWDSGLDQQVYPVDVKVILAAGKGSLASLSGVLGQMDANVVDIRMESRMKDLTVCHLRVEVRDSKHLQRILTALKGEKGVYRVQRGLD